MFILKKIGCRIFQAGFRLAMPLLPYREPKLISSCSDLKGVFAEAKTESALIVTDKGVVNNGLTKALEKVLSDSGIGYKIYDETQPNPTVKNVEEALLIYYKNRCDTLIAIGGGSSMDCAKAIGARVAYPKRALNKLGGKLKVWRRLPTLIAVPTTAGTGSEVTLAALITDSETHRKYAIMSFPLIPHYAVLDATLTYTLPPHLTATTGVDALTHAVESYIGRSTSKETRRLALESTKLIFENITTAYTDPLNRTARENMLHAAYKAGITLSKSYVGNIHAIAHSLGGLYGTPHGLANAVTMPYVLEAYGAVVYKKLKRLGVAAGVCSAADTPEVGAKKFIAAIKELNRQLNIPEKITGIKKEDIPKLAKHAEKEANPLYPVPKLYTKKELEGFYYKIGDFYDKQ